MNVYFKANTIFQYIFNFTKRVIIVRMRRSGVPKKAKPARAPSAPAKPLYLVQNEPQKPANKAIKAPAATAVKHFLNILSTSFNVNTFQ